MAKSNRLDRLLQTGANPALQTLLDEARTRQRLLTTIRSVLGEPLARGCIGASLSDNGDLQLLCISAALAARLRYEAPARLRSSGLPFGRVEVRVAGAGQDAMRISPHLPPSRPLPASAGDALRRCARTVDHPELARALDRLARHSDQEATGTG